MGSLLHNHLPRPLSGFCASKCTKNALTALEGDLTTCKPLPRPFSWIWEGREREMKGNGGGKERRGRKEEGGKGAMLALQTASLDPPLMDVQNEFTHKYTKNMENHHDRHHHHHHQSLMSRVTSTTKDLQRDQSCVDCNSSTSDTSVNIRL